MGFFAMETEIVYGVDCVVADPITSGLSLCLHTGGLFAFLFVSCFFGGCFSSFTEYVVILRPQQTMSSAREREKRQYAARRSRVITLETFTRTTTRPLGPANRAFLWRLFSLPCFHTEVIRRISYSFPPFSSVPRPSCASTNRGCP